MPDLGDIYRTNITQQIVERLEAFIAQETLDFYKHMGWWTLIQADW